MAQAFPEFLGNMGGIGGYQNGQRLQNGPAATVLGGQLIDTDHKGGHRGVEGEMFDVLLYFFDGPVQGPQVFGSGLDLGLSKGTVELPQLFQKGMHSTYSCSVPEFGLFQGAQEHLIET